jgi:glutathione peroxidase
VPLAIDGTPAPLAAYRGKVLLIVNVASQSGFTPQYEGLQWLYEKYKDQGLVVLAFPSNDFGQEEPGTNQEIKQFASQQFKVTFPLFAKLQVAGDHTAPLYRWLSDKQPVRWNFTKFLIGRDGKPVGRFDPDVEPNAPELVSAVEKALTGKTDQTGSQAPLASLPSNVYRRSPAWEGSIPSRMAG